MNPVDWTEFVRAINDARSVVLWLSACAAVLFVAWSLGRLWWAYRQQVRIDDAAQKKEAAAIAREEQREIRMGARIDEANGQVVAVLLGTVHDSTEAASKVAAALMLLTQSTLKCVGPRAVSPQAHTDAEQAHTDAERAHEDQKTIDATQGGRGPVTP